MGFYNKMKEEEERKWHSIITTLFSIMKLRVLAIQTP